MKRTLTTITAAMSLCTAAFAAPQKAADITVSGYTGSTTLENFPLLVRISPTRISGFSYADCAASGADISFKDAAGNVLAREIDTWDTAGESLVWVRVPSLASNEVITMTFKDATVTAQPSCQTDGSVWTPAGYAGVWHMNEASGSVADATGHDLAATPAGNTANSIAVSDAPIGTGRQTATSAGRGYLSIPSYDGLSLGNQFTVSGWVYFTGVSGYPRLFSRKNSYTDANGWEIEMQNGNYTKFTARGAGNGSKVDGTIPTLQKKWVHLAFVYNGTSLTAFANGAQVATGTIQAATDNGLPLSIGCDSNGDESYVLGYFDECRLLGATASADWIAASYASQSTSSFLTYGTPYYLFSNDILAIAGEPAEIGDPTPAYGQITGIASNTPSTLAMPVTTVAGEGTVTNYLHGWKLESVDMETAARALLRTSSDTGEVFNRCDYVHAGCAAFTWLWDVRDVIGVGAPILVANGGNSLTLSANVSGIGYTAPSATLKFAYGVSPDALVYTNVVSASVTGIGAVHGTITRLLPGVVYYVRAVIETNDGAHDTAESGTVAVQTDTVGENGEPGLWQTFFTSAYANWTKDIWAVPEGTDWKNYTDANRIRRRELTPIGAYTTLSQKYTSELWGDQIYWPVNGGQWAYAGHIWLDSTKTYKFRASIDDADRIVITDSGTGVETILISDTTYNTTDTSAAYSPSVTGWHYIEIRLSDNTGGAGGVNSASGYKNTTNLGFSQDGGSTWSLLQDPGDGSLLCAAESRENPAVVVINAEEIIANGRLASVSLSFASAEYARSLRAVWGPAHGGSDPADWLATSTVATVAAGATSATWTPPADWGSDSNLVVRFYFNTSPPQWSNSIFWRDYAVPSITGVAVDGTGGDTLVVSGTLASFPGADCTLTVYVGDSPTSLDNAWTGLAGSVRNAAGDFSLTLFESDTSSPRYLTPGANYYVLVQAVSDGKVTRSEPIAVAMEAAPVFFSASAPVSRRTVTFTASLSDVGMSGSATVTLYTGPASATEGDLVATESPVVRTASGSFTITHVFPAFETSYKWQLRAVSTSASGTSTLETRTAVGTIKTLDTTTYTWKTSVASGNWSDAANWTDNQGGDSLGYPQSSAASAVFAIGTAANVAFTEALTIGSLNLAANMNVTFSQGGASTNATKLTSGTITGHNNSTRGGVITLDGVAIASTSGDTFIDMHRSLRLVNGANLHLAGYFGQQASNDVLVADGSLLSCNGTYFGGGTLTISNATFWTRGENNTVGNNVAGGHIVFAGEHPLFYHGKTDRSFYSALASANVQLDFLVPVGGFAAAPLQAKATPSYFLGNNGGSAGSCALMVNVLDESPANFADATITTPLISWPTKGINKALVLEGHLPAYGAGAVTDDSFAWNDPAAANPTNLSVTIVGSSHAAQLQISGVSEAVESAELSPSYGFLAIASGSSRTCSAPSDYVYLSETKRAICTGWKLYDVDAATLARTLAGSGDTTTASITGTGLWQELEWQWRIEYRVTAAAGAGGSVSPAEQWIADGAAVNVSAIPDAGYGFAAWTGDVTGEDRMKKSVTFAVDGQAYALTASFNAARYVATDGDDGNDGLSAATPLATIAEALSRGALHIYVAEGVYDITETLVVSTATTIEGTGANRGAVIRYTKYYGGSDGPYVIELGNDNAALRNLTVTTASTDSKYGYARGVRMTGGLIDNCAITNCVVYNGSWSGGGGVNMSGGILRNSLLDGNSIYGAGGLKTYGGNINVSGGLIDTCVIRSGGARNRTNLNYAGVQASGGTIIRNCLIEGNKAAFSDGFAVYLSKVTMENCTIVGNEAPNSTSGSALYINPDKDNPVVIRNTIVWGNTTAGGLANWAIKNTTGLTAERIVTTPVITGTGNTAADPLFADFENGDYHPTLGSARNAGLHLEWMDLATDIDGNPRIAEGTPDIGCHEYVPAALDCSFDVAAGGALDSDTVTFAATVVGADLSGLVYSWTVTDQDGNAISRSGSDISTLTLMLGPGIYSARLDVENGAHDTASYARSNVVTVHPSHIYVDVNGANVMPFASYANGATNILDAVAFATDGTTIHVADGFYRYDSEILLNDAIRIVSENGPTNTTFFCSRAPLSLRSVNLANSGAVVSGIAITGIDTDNPASGTHTLYSFARHTDSGTGTGRGARPSIGGVSITSAGGMVTNCFIINHRGGLGAGATISGGTVVDCLFTNNWNYCTGGSGGAGGGILVDGSNALVERCMFMSNCVYYGSTSYGGGANVNSGTLRNCLFVGNQCTTGYGGNIAVRAANARVYHCTSVKGYGSLGNGGIYYANGTLADCISYDNVGNGSAEDTEDPGFIDYPGNDFHLSNASPAVDAATSGMGGDLDLDHMPRVSGPAADKGCYEYDKSQFSIGISYSSASFFSDTPVVIDAIATPEGTVIDEAQTWWTFDGTEPSVSNHDAVGSSVTNLFGLGAWTVRFKTIYNGQTYTVDKTDWFTRYGRTVYLVQENSGSAFPYGTPETAATNLTDAVLSAMDGATILVGDGTFMCKDGVKYVGRNLVVRSQNGPDRTTIDADGKNAMFFIRSGDWKVVIDGIRFVNGGGYVDGGAIRINDADSVITNCVFDSCRASAYGGGGVYADAGTIVDCLFTNCWCGNGNGPVGAALRIGGASTLADRCILLDSHYVHDAASVTRGALYVNNGTVRNTVVARSRLTGEGGILATGSAKVQNCTVVDNVSELAGYVAGIKVEGSATVKNTIIWHNVNEADGVRSDIGGDTSSFDHCFTDDPCLIGKRGREFLIRSNSPCRDAGAVESWMARAKDVYGNPRIDKPNKPVDIGAAECQRTDSTMLIFH